MPLELILTQLGGMQTCVNCPAWIQIASKKMQGLDAGNAQEPNLVGFKDLRYLVDFLS
jgi:hypothetical protein